MGPADNTFAVTVSPLTDKDISVWQTGHRSRRDFDCGFTRKRLLQLGQGISAMDVSLAHFCREIYLGRPTATPTRSYSCEATI